MKNIIKGIESVIAELEADQNPNYKDSWERGYDVGRAEAAQKLKKLLEDAA